MMHGDWLKTMTYSRVPVLHDVRDITLARDDLVALVSYENKVGFSLLAPWVGPYTLHFRHLRSCGR